MSLSHKASIRAVSEVGALLDDLGWQTQPLGRRHDRVRRVVDRDELHEDRELDVSVAGHLAHLLGLRDRAGPGRVPELDPTRAVEGEPCQLDDVRSSGGDGEHPRTEPADEDRGMRLLQARDAQAADLTLEKVDEHPEPFVEAVDTFAWRRQRDPDCVVLGLRVPGTEPELEAAIGEKVDGCRLASEQRLGCGTRC